MFGALLFADLTNNRRKRLCKKRKKVKRNWKDEKLKNGKDANCTKKFEKRKNSIAKLHV